MDWISCKIQQICYWALASDSRLSCKPNPSNKRQAPILDFLHLQVSKFCRFGRQLKGIKNATCTETPIRCLLSPGDLRLTQAAIVIAVPQHTWIVLVAREIDS